MANYTEEEERITSQNLPTKEILRQLAEAGYDRTRSGVDAWRQKNRIYRTNQPKREKLIISQESRNRFPVGLRD